MQWSAKNVSIGTNGTVELVFGAPARSLYSYRGGEIQRALLATTGTWGWTVQVLEMVPEQSSDCLPTRQTDNTSLG